MGYLNKSTLTYPATNSFPNGIWEDVRNPTVNDYRNFQVGAIWINTALKNAWILVDKTNVSGTFEGIWIQAAATGTGILELTGNSGGPIVADGSNNINLLGSGTISVTGTPSTHTLTISQSGTVATSYVETLGSAVPSGGVLNIVGGFGISTSGLGNTITITSTSGMPGSFVTNSGTAMPSSGVLDILGSGGITTSGTGNTVTITPSGTIATTYDADTGSATPAANILTIHGAGGITTSGTASTVTITAGATIPTTFTANSGMAMPAANNLNVLGTGAVSTSATGSTITISAAYEALPWVVIATTTEALAVNTGYTSNNASLMTGTLPTTASVGATIVMTGLGAGGWLIAQNAGQVIHVGASVTTTGTSGSIASTNQYDSIMITCVVANTTWVTRSIIGNLTIT